MTLIANLDIAAAIPKLIQIGEKEPQALTDAFELVRQLENQDAVFVDGEELKAVGKFRLAHQYNAEIRAKTAKIIKETGDEDMLTLNTRTLLFDAPYNFDCYCRYIEWNRPQNKKFYEPRRKQLRPLAEKMQMLSDGKLDLLAISMPPGTGKSTLGIFFLTWLAGRDPRKSMLVGSHNNAFLKGVYDEFARMLDPEGEYLWGNVFPKYKIIKTDAKNMNIDVGRSEKDAKRFTTLELSSIGSGNAGKVRAEQLLYCDDLVDGIESALSKERMDKLWGQYVTDLRQRKIGNCKELHIATRWSVHDVIGRLEVAYGDAKRAAFVAVPALDENDESNFDYANASGFTTKFYHDQREIMDDVSWRALYMNQPIEREGTLYPADELRRFLSIPNRDPDAVLSVVDTKTTGDDYFVMPIIYQYGNDFFCVDCICDNNLPNVVQPRIVGKMMQHRIHMSRFESNQAGGKIAEEVQTEIKRRNGRTTITTKYSTANKETRIIVASGWVKENVLFWDDSYYKVNKEYGAMMNFLTGYTVRGKNRHDDVPDAFASLADFVNGIGGNRVEIIRRPF